MAASIATENAKSSLRSKADITISIPHDLKDKLRAWADNHSSSASAVVENALNIFFLLKYGDSHD